jgi:hypothetical protein
MAGMDVRWERQKAHLAEGSNGDQSAGAVAVSNKVGPGALVSSATTNPQEAWWNVKKWEFSQLGHYRKHLTISILLFVPPQRPPGWPSWGIATQTP